MKYSAERLKAMSTALLRYKSENPDVYLQFLLNVAVRAGCGPDYVERMIVQYSRGN